MAGDIQIKIRVNQTVDIVLDVEEIVSAVNELPVTKRWNAIAGMLNYIDFREEELTEEQQKITIDWLENKLQKLTLTRKQK